MRAVRQRKEGERAEGNRRGGREQKMKKCLWRLVCAAVVILLVCMPEPRQTKAQEYMLETTVTQQIKMRDAAQSESEQRDTEQRDTEQRVTEQEDAELEEQEDREQNEIEQDYLEQIMAELDLDEMEDAGWEPENLPQKLEFRDMVEAFVEKGTDGIDGGMICEYVFDLFFYEIAAARPLFAELLAVSLLFALFGRILATKQEYVSEIGFFAVYTGVLMLLLQSFSLIASVVEEAVGNTVSFMTAFIPTYATTLFLSGNAASAGVFYETAFGVIYLLELGMRFLLMPGVSVFVLLMMMDHFFKESKFAKLAQFLEDGIRLLLKLGLAAVTGLGVVQSFLAPAKDRLSVSGVYHGLSTIPGIGNTFGGVGEILVGCGMMIKNSLGAAALILLCVICFAPVIKVFCFYVMYRLVAAFLWPFCDKRIAGCIHDMGQGCSIYLRIMVDVVLLFFITVSIISAATSFVY